jgi:predicted RecA/RadA family phage recombinase
MLSVLAQTFSIAVPDEQGLLMKVSVELMEASASVSVALARMPAGQSHPGVDAGITFAVPRSSAYRPLHSRARPIFLERVQQLQAAANQVLSGETRKKAMRRLGNANTLLDGPGGAA